MAGTIENNLAAYKKQTYKYIPPTPPKELISTSTFTIDFIARKFIHVGLDDKLNLVLHIITSSRHVILSPEILKRIFNLMGNILSIILDTPDKTNAHVFLEDSKIIATKMVYRGENMLVIESKTTSGCRILLNRKDILRLQDLEIPIFETIIRKNIYTKSLLNKQMSNLVSYFSSYNDVTTKEDMHTTIRKYNITQINKDIIHNEYNYDFMAELILLASEEIANRWKMHLEAEIKRNQEVRINIIFYFNILIYIYILIIF